MEIINLMWIWIAIIIVTIIIEIVTVGLTSIWLTGGALCALLAWGLGASFAVQIIVFFVFTFILLFFTRPIAVKYLNKNRVKTNYEDLIDKEVRVIEEVNNHVNSGKAIYNGMEWSAQALVSEEIFSIDEIALVDSIEGVRLILKKSSQK